MEPVVMLQTAVLLFALAAAGGLVMAWIRMGRKHNPPIWLSMLHGLLAAGGLTLVAYAFVFADTPRLTGWALLLFALAAGGGTAMNLGWHWERRPLPVSIILVHGALAVAGFGCLFVAAF